MSPSQYESERPSLNYDDLFSGRDPLQITLVECMLTYTCNIRCVYCFNPHHRRGDELAVSEWKDAIASAADLGAVATIFNGGEPLAYSGHTELIRYAHDLGLITGISSNGLMLDPAKVDELAGNLDVLQISLHPWRYIDDLAGGIQPFTEHARRFKAHGGRRAVFKVVLYRGLADRLEELLDVVSELASDVIDSFGVQAALPLGYGFANPESMPTFEEVKRSNELIEWYALTSPLEIENGLYDHFTVRPNLWGRYGVIINPEGEVYPLIEAVELLSDEIRWDSLRRSSLEEIWGSSPVMNRFRGIEWHQQPCRSCVLRDDCRGGSRLNAYIVTKDIHAADPFCVLSPEHESLMAVYQA